MYPLAIICLFRICCWISPGSSFNIIIEVYPYRPSNICQPGTHLLGLGQSLRSAVGCAGRRRSGKWVSPLHPPYPASPLSLSPSNLPPRPPWVVPPLIVERDRPEVAPHTPVAYQSHANGAVHCCKLLQHASTEYIVHCILSKWAYQGPCSTMAKNMTGLVHQGQTKGEWSKAPKNTRRLPSANQKPF